MEAVRRRRQVVTQPVDEREPVAGWQLKIPFNNNTASVPVAVNEDVEDISIRKAVHNEQLSVDEEACFLRQASVTSTASSNCPASDDDSAMVVDMRQALQFHNSVRVRQPGLTERDVGINVREHSVRPVDDDLADLQIAEELDEPSEKQRGYVTYGDDADIRKLLEEKPPQKGIICCDKVLHCGDGVYREGHEYRTIPGTESKGAFGEAAMCQDLHTGKTFMLKKVRGNLCKNEIEVPMMFKGSVGIPEVYGVIRENETTLIFQEFAGMSMKKLNDSAFAEQLRDAKMVMLFAFQAFATLDKLHSQGVTHQDVKPENLCLDIQAQTWRLKLIDFGSSQTPGDVVTEGLTNEYLSPESCRNILQVAMGKMSRAEGRLGPANDVWAMALSLLYSLCGYHVMVYACTGDTVYRDTDPVQLQRKRIQCVLQICNLTDADIARKLIHADWPEALKVLLLNTLHVNPQDRWTAKQAAYYIYTNWIMKGGSASMELRPPAAPGNGFTGLAPPRLVVRTQAILPQGTSDCAQNETGGESQATQCTSPTGSAPPTPSAGATPAPTAAAATPSDQLPAFTDLLSDGLSKLKLRSYKRKQQRDGPYVAARRGAKVLKT